MTESINIMLRKLRLSGMRQTLEVRLQEAAGNRLTPLEFLELVLSDEINVRQQRRIQRRVKAAQFKELATLQDFDFQFNASIKRSQIFDLATCQFVRNASDVLFIGPPGVGKSHLAQALGYEAVKADFTVKYRSIFDLVRDFRLDDAYGGEDKILAKYLKPDLLIVDDMGLKKLPAGAGEYLFEVIMRRHRVRSTIMTSNRPIEDWGKLIDDVPAAGAILDRFLQDADMIGITGRSYRLRNRTEKEKAQHE